MSEFRHDPVHRRWVIVTVDRIRSPRDYSVPSRNPDEGFCPFCEGQEAKTPAELHSHRSVGQPDKPGWQVRVFPNRYPALSCSESEVLRGGQGTYDWINGVGCHEIVVEHPQHHMLFHQLKTAHMQLIIEAWRTRLQVMLQDERCRYVMMFKSHGQAAGATLNHQHSQLMAMPVIPRIAAMALGTARDHFRQKERCLFCDILDQETSDGSRIVAQNEHFVCFVPYASRFPFEMNILPVAHSHDFSSMADSLVEPAADIIRQAVGKLAALFGDVPFNLALHTGPNTNQSPKRSGYWATLRYDWHWQIEIIPRLGTIHGFEWSTGLFINPTPPEEAARFLREVTL